MKPAPSALANLINSDVFVCWDIYTFTTNSGLVIRLTTADFDIIDTSGNVYPCGWPGARGQVTGHWLGGSAAAAADIEYDGRRLQAAMLFDHFEHDAADAVVLFLVDGSAVDQFTEFGWRGRYRPAHERRH